MYFGDGSGLLIADGSDWKIQFPLELALPEELVAHFYAPLVRYVPWSGGVRDVGALERYLHYELPVLGPFQVQRALV